jgi:hypothetical protein
MTETFGAPCDWHRQQALDRRSSGSSSLGTGVGELEEDDPGFVATEEELWKPSVESRLDRLHAIGRMKKKWILYLR